MIDRVKSLLQDAWGKAVNLLPKVKAQDSMLVIIAYGALLGIISAAFLFAWICDGTSSGKFDADIMLRFFTAATGAGPVAAVTFLSVFLVDKNKDGRPDAAEEKSNREEKKKW